MNRPARGFTLIETLLAAALLALGVAIAFGALQGAVASVRRAEALAERSDHVRAAQHFLRRQLAQARPQAWQSGDDVETDPAWLLEGGSDQVRFAAAMPGYLSHGGPYLQTLRLARGEDGLALWFEHAMLAGNQVVVDTGREPVALLEGIAEARFAYLGLDEQGEIGDWEPEWPWPERLPLLLRLDVRFEDPALHWPPLVVELALAGGGAAGGALPRQSPRSVPLRPETAR